MFTPTFTLTPITNDTGSGGHKERASDDWRSYAVAAAIALNGGFRAASKRMVRQAREKIDLIPPSSYRAVALNICELIVAADRRRFERATMLKQTAIDGMRSISGSELEELKDVLEQICNLLELKS